MSAEDDQQRHLSRVQKLLALAGSTCNEHETALAVERVVAYLDEHPLPMRWRIRKGVEIRLLPLSAFGSTQEAKATIRRVVVRKDNWFGEEHRVKDSQDILRALSMGYLFFQRHGYAFFLPVKEVEVSL